MTTSIVIATYCRWGCLERTLDSIFSQIDDRCEVIVVDQTPAQPIPDSLRERLKNTVVVYNRVRPASLPAARNFGVAMARGNLVIFVDDDVMLEDGFLAAHRGAYQDPNILGVAGRVKMVGDSGALLPPSVTVEGEFVGGFSHANRAMTNCAMGCNMSFRKSELLKCGGFDPSFSGNSLREESDLCLRITKKKHRLVFEPAASLLHLPAKDGGCRAKDPWDSPDIYHNHALFFIRHFPGKLGKMIFWKLFFPNVYPYKGQLKLFFRRFCCLVKGVISAIGHRFLRKRVCLTTTGGADCAWEDTSLDGQTITRSSRILGEEPSLK